MVWQRGNTLALTCFVIFFAYFITITPTELVVNVRNQGGEIFQESIWANLTDETVHLEVEQPDGSVVIQFIDFKNEIQILNAFILGEEELHSPKYQVLCFVTHFQKAAKEFIPVDAMAKLRQKNAWAIRNPERDMGEESHGMDALLDTSTAEWISPHIRSICADAQETTYGIESELETLVSLRSLDKNNETSAEKNLVFREHYLRTVKPFPIEQLKCGGESVSDKPCRCRIELCVGWYPCALKYCQMHDSAGKFVSSYRCGIHTCKKCRRFTYSVSRKFFCI